MAVSKRLRYEILRRDNHACRYCGASAPDTTLRIDHVLPVALGGSDEPENLVTACHDCNAGKAASSPDASTVADVRADSLRWARAIEAAQEITDASREKRDYLRAHFYGCWTGDFSPKGRREVVPPLPREWEMTIDRFVNAGLGERDLGDAIAVAISQHGVYLENRFQYFCGVAWGMVRDRQDVARTIAATDDVDPTEGGR